MNKILLKKLENKDIPLMKNWLKQEYIKKWYDPIEDWIYELENKDIAFNFLNHQIVLSENTPIGFAQYYPCASFIEDWYAHLDLNGVYSIDYLIGEKEYLQQGLGKEIISQLIQTIFALPNAKSIVVQPDKENIASCAALLKSGFTYDKQYELYMLEKKQ